MNYKIIPTPEFIKNLKKLGKKYKSIKKDVWQLSQELENNPTIGISLGNNTYKIRLKNSDSKDGKSGGYRVITYCVTQEGELYLVTIYSKTQQEDILESELEKIIETIGA